MSNKRICVYGICKNELQFVDRFVESVGSDVDIFIGDTGSTDGTVEAFRKYPNVTVFEYKISPWRFDTARQTCLDMIPNNYDLYFSLDIDEFIITKDWIKLFNTVPKEANQVYYKFEPYFDENGKPTSTFFNNRIHTRDFHWTYCVHEVITPNTGLIVKAFKIDNLVVHHLPDPNKVTSSYLPLLELNAQEFPDDPRSYHYLGREYLYHMRHEDSIRTLEHHINMKNSNWSAERACSCRLISENYNIMGEEDKAEFWLLKSVAECSIIRESWIDLSKFYYHRQRWRECLSTAIAAYNIKNPSPDHYSVNFYSSLQGGGAQDLMAVSYYNLGMFNEALKFAEEALICDPNCKRYQDNVTSLRNIVNDINKLKQPKEDPISLENIMKQVKKK